MFNQISHLFIPVTSVCRIKEGREGEAYWDVEAYDLLLHTQDSPFSVHGNTVHGNTLVEFILTGPGPWARPSHGIYVYVSFSMSVCISLTCISTHNFKYHP